MTDATSCRLAGGLAGTFGTCLSAACPVINSCCVPRYAGANGVCLSSGSMNADTCKRLYPVSLFYPNMDCAIAPCDDLDWNGTDFLRDLYSLGACCLRGECYSRVPPNSCRRVGGSYLGTTTCATANACAATSPYGRCCYYQGTALSCLADSSKLDCVVRNGAWTAGQNCSSSCKAPRLPDPLPISAPPTPGIGGTLPSTGTCRSPPGPESACPIVDWSIWSQVTGTELNIVFANARKLGRNVSDVRLRANGCDLHLNVSNPAAEVSTCSVIYQTATILLKDLTQCTPLTQRAGSVDAQYFEVVAVQHYLAASAPRTNDLVYQFWLLPGTGLPTVTVTGQTTQTATYDRNRHSVTFSLTIGRSPVFTGAPAGTTVTGAGPYTVEVPLPTSSCGQSFVFYDLQAGYAQVRISLVVPETSCSTAGQISTLAYSISTCNTSVVVFQSNKNIGWLLLETPTCIGSLWFTRVPTTWNDGVADRFTYSIFPGSPAWSLFLDLNPFFAPFDALRLDHIIGPSGPTEPCSTTPPTGTQTNTVVIGGSQAYTGTASNGNTGTANGNTGGTSGNTNGGTGGASGSTTGPGSLGPTDTTGNSNGGTVGSTAGPVPVPGPSPTDTPSPTANAGTIPVLARLLLATLLL